MTEKNHYGYCSHCNASFDGDEIPEDQRPNYTPPFIWSQRIELKCACPCDRTMGYKCHECGFAIFICQEVGNA